MKYLEQDLRNKNVLSVDETWLGMADYRQRHWRSYKENCSIRAKKMQPRISMIVAVDRYGEVYLSLTQSNSNQSMMGIFIERLSLKLDKTNPHWRNNTIICWDGAAYHKAAGTQKLLERLNVPIMMLGPYSYNAAPCELFFAAFKSADINPSKVPLGKGNFDEVVRLVVQRCQ